MKNILLILPIVLVLHNHGFLESSNKPGLITQAKLAPVFSLTVSNIKNTEAKIRVGFYRKNDGFPAQGKASIIKVFVPKNLGTSTIEFTDIPFGEYSIALFQDINGDEIINKNFFGYPKEPFGFSKNFIPKLTAPKYEDCKIIFDENHRGFTINLLK